MRNTKFMDLITHAYEATQELLFKSFDIKRWLKFVLIVFLSGSFIGGFNVLDINQFFNFDKKIPQNVQEAKESADKAQALKNTNDTEDFKAVSEVFNKFTIQKNNLLLVAFAFLIFIFIIASTLVFMWIGSRFECVYFQTLISKSPEIRRDFHLFKLQGDDLFKFYLKNFGIGLIFFVMCLGCAFGAAIWFQPLMQLSSPMVWILSIIVGVLILSAFVCWFLIVVNVYVKQFVVSIMLIDQSGFDQAWSRFWAIYKERNKDFLQYLLMIILINIILAIVVSLAMLVCILALLLVGVIIFGSIYILTAVLLKSLLAFTIIAAILAIPFIGALIVLGCSVALPAAVFMRYFSLYFLSSLNVGYQPVALLAKLATPQEGE